MCGLAGFIFSSDAKSGLEDYPEVLRKMGASIVRRGPDDSGLWVDRRLGIGLVHQRLSILDLSPAGHQPMISASGRFTLVFNGEIYNHRELRTMLINSVGLSSNRQLIWRGHSDTETLLAGFEVWGFEETIKKCVGMFAIALWDRAEKVLLLARDRMGEKPLYYGWQGAGKKRCFIFGSELKALKAHPSFLSEIDRDALCLFMRYSYIPAPHSIYKNIFKLEPGSILALSLENEVSETWKYWDMTRVAMNGKDKPFVGSPTEAVDELESLVRRSIKQQMVADVPLGAFLSGGIDSSTVVAVMQSESIRPVKTFTIGFEEKGFNEAIHARAVSQHLGTEHFELYVTASQSQEVIPNLSSLYSEPFADVSQIPTFLVSQLAKERVTVALSGDGGDELFCGYNRYKATQRIWSKLALIPSSARSAISKGITSISASSWDKFFSNIPHLNSYPAIGDRLHKGAGVMMSGSVNQLYLGFLSHIDNPSDWIKGGCEPPTRLTTLRPKLNGLSDIEEMMVLDTISYLPDDILVKVDRATMGVSLEGRIPFLDYRIVEFASSLPLCYKIREGQAKWPLRQLLHRYIPPKLIDRPKMGFGVPLREWLCGPLRDWAEELLSEERLNREGYFNSQLVRKFWVEHLSGERNWQAPLWNVLMFQSWLENNRS
jgi:asparagine synthase (glutamine-hydrolysing)